MNKTIKLLIEWDSYEQENPHANLDEFCRYYLAKQNLSEENTSANSRGLLLRTMGRITSAFNLYQRAAMSETQLPFHDGFYYLNGLAHIGEVRKTDLINYLLVEYTTGMEAIAKLLYDDFIQTRPDETDGRARLISLTEKGRQTLAECYKYMAKAGEMIFSEMSEEAIQLCIQQLEAVEKKHSVLAVEVKGKSFEEMYNYIKNH
ncbi:MarR family winged helix-turn-helix transcriptional regulator [Emticicia sp. C21]|uniref:MarR family winged helix-turn-helix transcriptional regulator n=1 Tax=Emticicia sp. C21 TaxID=2302915 RepID=UPI000E34F18A|nr:MarR family winged helix-turn-helix transcriptional regulator [Emticicia sp. C21]RFS14884.1 MarR family transcriptional regulator [Emticicia sp. C21]